MNTQAFITISIAFAGLILTFSAFYVGRRASAKATGIELGKLEASTAPFDAVAWGKLEANIEHIKDDVQVIKSDIKDTRVDYMQKLADQEKAFKESIRRVHKRIDEHEKDYHDKIITRNETSEV